MENYCFEEEILFTDKKVFGDDLEHPFDCKCYDGYAECVAVDCEENDNLPNDVITVTYPLRDTIVTHQRKAYQVLEYRGLFDLDVDDITFGDIMVCFGKIEKTGN